MVYNVKYKSSVKKDLKRISKQEIKKILDKIESELTKNPLLFPSLTGEFKGLRKLRVGNFRVIYTILGDEVLILKIGDRKDVYK